MHSRARGPSYNMLLYADIDIRRLDAVRVYGCAYARMGWERHNGSGSSSPAFEELTCSLGTVPCILTYDGDPQPLAINYTVLVVLLIVAAAELAGAQRPGAIAGERIRRAAWQVAVFMVLVGGQVSFCVLVQRTGISVIWNAMTAFLLLQRRRARLEYSARLPKKKEIGEPHALVLCVEWTIDLRPVDHIVHFGVAVAASADLYYLRTADTMINIAHGCALVLGVALEHHYARQFENPTAPEPEPEPQSKQRQHDPREYVQVEVDESVEVP
jgi:hypothetical protein